MNGLILAMALTGQCSSGRCSVAIPIYPPPQTFYYQQQVQTTQVVTTYQQVTTQSVRPTKNKVKIKWFARKQSCR